MNDQAMQSRRSSLSFLQNRLLYTNNTTTTTTTTKISASPTSLTFFFFQMEHLTRLSNRILSTLFEVSRLTLLAFSLATISIIFLQRWSNPISHFTIFFLSCFLLTKLYFSITTSPVYIVDFSCLKPPNFCRVPMSVFLEHISLIESFDQESVSFMTKIVTSSGLGQETYLPPALHHIPPKSYHQESIQESQMVLFPIVQDLLSKTKLSPLDIDILIVNCSGFCTSPSLTSIIINKFSMKENIKSYNLSGMGCSAGAIAIDFAKNLLKVNKNSNALVVSSEILSTGWYEGHEREKLLLNCVFRMGSSAILLSNKKSARKSSKYKLSCTVRSQRAFDDKGYLSSFREEDADGKLGVTIKRDLLKTAGEIIHNNISSVGSQILPLSEKILHSISVIRKRFLNKSCEIYVPNFKKVVDHFCLPTAGRPLIREMAKGLKLSDGEVEAAMATLHRFGNQSSSALWYELSYLEAKGIVKKGERVWLIGMGTGPKGCSIIFECLRPIIGESKNGPWADCLHRYPIMAIDQSF